MINVNPQQYPDPLMTGSILVGYKGSSYLDAGYYYEPYIPLYQTPVVCDPTNFPIPKLSKISKYRSIDDDWDSE